MVNLLITDGENRSALAATRSLGRKGCRVVVTSKQARNIACSSRFCAKGYLTPDPSKAGAEYATTVRAIIERERIDVVFPMTEVSIQLLNNIRPQLPANVILGCPPADKMAAVSNKSDLFHLAEALNVPTPSTLYLPNNCALPALLDKIPPYPVVIKPALSKIPHQGSGFLSGGVRYAASQHELERLYRTSPVLRYPSVIQEKIVGPGTGLFTLFDGSRHLALFSHRRLREKPPSGGVSVVSESVPLDEEMVEASSRLLSAVGFRGVAMVEFKRDLRDGKAKLMEINGRFWGTLQLAVSCGIDFPSLLLDLLLGQIPPRVVRGYRVGKKMKWFFGTLDHLWIRLKSRDEALNLPPEFPSKMQSLIDFLSLWEKDTSFDVFDYHDIGPFLTEARSYLSKF